MSAIFNSAIFLLHEVISMQVKPFRFHIFSLES